ncbi:MAG TPA: hypothetical protein VI957_02915 [Candidatus Paceibacterota bacterium]
MVSEQNRWELLATLFGFKEGGELYPCHFCGIVTKLLDPEDFHVCERCQTEHVRIGYAAMEKKYPLAGKNERNSEFFVAQREAILARAERITEGDLALIEERGTRWSKDLVKKLRAGILSDTEKVSLGYSAKDCVDEWRGK